MTTTALGQSTTSSVPIARTGTTAAVTSVGRNLAAYGSTALAPPVASETARDGSGREPSSSSPQRRSRAERSAVETVTPAQAATHSLTPARPARTTKSAASQTRAVVSDPPPTTATTTAEITKADAIVATPATTPRAPRAATGLRAAGTARRSRGSKGFTRGPRGGWRRW